jgi:hypothetical protein
VGCSRGDDAPALVGDVPTTASTTTTTEPAPPTTAPAACPPVDRAPEGDGAVERRADVDGDGRPDLVQSFPTPGRTGRVTLLVELAAGGGAALELESEREPSTALLGTAIVERVDRRHLLWVRVGGGASTVVVGLFWLDGCALGPVVDPSGDPVELPVGGSVRSVAGAECGSLLDPQADLLVYEGRSVDGREYAVTVSEHRYEGGTLTPSPEAAPRTDTTDDPTQASRFRCGDVEL